MKRRTKIFLNLSGGFGNQMFQLSAAFKMAKSLKIGHESIYIVTSSLKRYRQQREFSLFFIKDIFPKIKIVDSGGLLIDFIFYTRISKIPFLKFFVNTCEDITTKQYKSILNRYILDGYFQDNANMIPLVELEEIKKYFHSRAKVICEKKKINKPFSMMHIRRGDYISDKKAIKRYSEIEMSFYKEALDKLKKSKDIFNLIIFSDDRMIADK